MSGQRFPLGKASFEHDVEAARRKYRHRENRVMNSENNSRGLKRFAASTSFRYPISLE